MPESLPIDTGSPIASCCASRVRPAVYWLQGITLALMLVEFGASVYAAVTAHSTAMLAFGSDSFVELLSASVVLLQWSPSASISQRTAARGTAVLLIVLAVVIGAIAVASFVLKVRVETSCVGMAITVAALIAMPILAAFKRREARRTNNQALAADSVQSATYAYLAGVTLTGSRRKRSLSLRLVRFVGRVGSRSHSP